MSTPTESSRYPGSLVYPLPQPLSRQVEGAFGRAIPEAAIAPLLPGTLSFSSCYKSCPCRIKDTLERGIFHGTGYTGHHSTGHKFPIKIIMDMLIFVVL